MMALWGPCSVATRQAGSAMQEFRARRLARMRENSKFMMELVAAIGAFAAWVALDHGTRQLIAAFLLGSILTIALFGWLLGFDVRSLSWKKKINTAGSVR